MTPPGGTADKSWRAIANEASTAAEHFGIGVTALGRANYAQQGYYAQAFFALSVAIERSGKLVLLLDHALDHKGEYPNQKAIRSYGPDLAALLRRAESIGAKHNTSEDRESLPGGSIHDGIVETLTEFARNVTRYYNLDVLAGGAAAEGPIEAWRRKVTEPVLAEHYRPQHRAKREENAREVAQLLQGGAYVRFHDETGSVVDSVYEASRLTGESEFARPWERMYVLRIARFLGSTLATVGDAAGREGLSVPHMAEFFAIFGNRDDYFRSRKTWSIYSP